MTSGTFAFDLDVEGVIERALQMAMGDIDSGDDLRQARVALSLLLLDMQNRSHPIAELENKTFTCTSGTASYTLSAGTVDILDAVLVRSSTATPLDRIGLFEYHKIPNKTVEGKPTQFAIDRDRSLITVYLYNTPENSTDVVDYWCITNIEDPGPYSTGLDLSTRYLPAVTFGLAYFILLGKDVSDPNLAQVIAMKRQELKSNYLEALDNATLEDRERVSFRVTPHPYHRR